MHCGFSYRLYPTPEQAQKLAEFSRVCRVVYNAALEQRDTQWRKFQEQTGKKICLGTQSQELTKAREEIEWIRDVPRAMQEQALRDLDTAFQRFFKGVSGYPRFRRKDVDESIRFQGRDCGIVRLNRRWSTVKVPNLGRVRFRDTRSVDGDIKHVTVAFRAGQWSVSFGCELSDEIVSSMLASKVGIDRWVANAVALSTGEMIAIPSTIDAIDRRRKRAQRDLARKHRGSARYKKQRLRVARLAAQAARVRRNWQHQTTTRIANHFGTVVIEALRVASMTASGRGKRGLNRAILRQGWGGIETMLAYKLEERGGRLVKIDPAYTSQTCSECGAIDPKSRESQAVFRCRHCGHKAHADVNAAVNILRRGDTALLRVEGSYCGPVEARTVNHAAPLAA